MAQVPARAYHPALHLASHGYRNQEQSLAAARPQERPIDELK